MPRGAKAKLEAFSEIQEMAKGLGSVEELQELLAKKVVEDGLKKPNIDDHPGLKEAVDNLVSWCKDNNRRLTIDGEGCKIRMLRKKKDNQEPAAE